ncbi:MAG: extracellular solute-binding protein [Clostridiaceae bacterium]|nr:extracellular solute-binding protein [Clostridiaceae bacterium]
MKKRLNKLTAIGVAVSMTALCMGGCGGETGSGEKVSAGNMSTEQAVAGQEQSVAGQETGQEQAEQGADVAYPLERGGKLTFGMPLAKEWSDRYDKWTDLPIGKAAQEETGVELEMVHVENNTAMNLLFASGELPDIVLFNFQSNYSGGESKAIEDGIVFPMDAEFLQKNAPDYWAVLNSDEDIMKGSTNQNNQVFGFTFIMGDDSCKTGYGLTVRDDWCEKLGMDVSQIDTAEEFKDMLAAFKNELGVPVPLTITSENLTELLDYGVITSPFGLATRDMYQVDGKVHIGYAEQEYKDVLQYLNQLYSEGLLDPNFSTTDKETVTANMLSGTSGASSGALGGGIGTWLQTNRDVEDYSLAGMHNLVKNDGEKSMYGFYKTDVIGKTAVITTSCKDKELAAKFLNYGYTDPGHMTYVFGIEGESYNMENGEPVYTDYIMNNPDGLTVKKAMSEYTLSWDNGPFVQDIKQKEQTGGMPEQLEAWKIWEDTTVDQYFLPKIIIAQDSLSEYSNLKSDITTYVKEMTIKFIRGTEPIENYDKYLENLKAMGVDRLVEIVQAATDEYYSR